MKKANLFIYTLIVTILSIVSVNAKMMNVDEIGKEVEAKASGARYVYIIGKYAYTSTYENFTLQDVMLAASDSITINGGTENIQSQVSSMTIYRIDRTYEGYTAKGWKLGSNEIGTGTDLNDNKQIDVRYIDYQLLENESTATVSVDLEDAKHSTYKSTLQSALGFEAKDNYGREGNKLTVEDGKVKGLLLRNKDKITLSPEDKAKYSGKDYYLAYIIEVPNATNDTKVTVKSPNITEGEEVDHDLFDVKISEAGENKTPGVVMLVPLSPESAKNGKIEVTIDLDGDNNSEYGPTTYTLDLSELEFQEDSKIQEIGLGKDKATEADKKTLEGWGYKSENNQNMSISNEDNNLTYKLTGKLVEQKLSDSVYGASNADAYYFDFTLVLGNNQDKKATVKATVGGNTDSKTFQKEEYDDNGNLTILQRISKDTTCDKQGENNKCIIKLEIDLDGSEDKYLPQTYTLDYSSLTFEKSSLFTVEAISENSKSQYDDDAWYNTDDGYNVKVTPDETDPSKYKVSGLLPILEDSEWNGGKEPFESQNELYYLGLGLKLANVSEDFSTNYGSTFNVVFDHDTETKSFKKIFGSDFSTSKTVYILKALRATNESGAPLTDAEKYFTITVDSDDDGEEYAPYTVTIDYSGLEFQSKSFYTEAKPVTNVNTDNKGSEGYILPEDKKAYEEFGYNFDNVGENIGLSVDNGHYSLTGSIKEQNVSKAGFQTADGYYLVVKIYGPTDEEVKNSILESDNKKWTIRVKSESGEYKEPVTPTQEDYDNGFITVLFKLKEQAEKKEIKYEIDWDGEGDYFLPYEETIDYSSVTFLSAHKVTFDDQKSETENQSIIFWDGDKVEPKDIATPTSDEYHEFAYWNKENGTNIESIVLANENDNDKTGKETGDITLVPHWNLYSDKFIADVLEDLNSTDDSTVSENFSEDFTIEKYVPNSGEITINVVNPSTKLSRMKDTTIPGAISYILLKNEIKEISLSVGDVEEKFNTSKGDNHETLKAAVQAGAQELYNRILPTKFGDSASDNTVNLSNLASSEYNSFTLKFDPEKVSKTVTLMKAPEENGISLASDISVPTTYIFTFESDIVSVNSLESLENALKGTQKTIFIEQGFEVNKQVEITRNVIINGNEKTLTATNNIDSIFTVKSPNVTIDNITLKNSTRNAIIVESGSLTTTGLKVTMDEDKAAGFESAIKVENGTLVASNIDYEKETYLKPAVKAAKTNTNISLLDSKSNPSQRIEKETITKLDLNDKREKDSTYTYYNYYNLVANSKIYTTVFYTHEAGYRLSYTKYDYYLDKITPPNSDRFKAYDYDGEHYELIGFSENSWRSVIRNEDLETLTDVITPENLKASADKHYWASFKLTPATGVERVNTEQTFKAALDKQDIHSIYITKPIEINLTDETLTISRKLSIIGPSGKEQPTIKVKKVVIEQGAEDVFFNRINLEINADAGQESLIEVNSKKFSFWQGGLSNTGSSVNYAIKYKNTKSVVDIRWMGLTSKGFAEKNINKAYIDVEGGLAEGTEIYLNTFKKLTEENDSAIIIKKFDPSAKITEEDIEPDIRLASNTFNTKYAITLLEETSGQDADIKIDTSSSIKIGVKYNEEHQDFSKINIYANVDRVTPEYINADGSTSPTPPVTGKGLSFKSKTEMLS